MPYVSKWQRNERTVVVLKNSGASYREIQAMTGIPRSAAQRVYARSKLAKVEVDRLMLVADLEILRQRLAWVVNSDEAVNKRDVDMLVKTSLAIWRVMGYDQQQPGPRVTSGGEGIGDSTDRFLDDLVAWMEPEPVVPSGVTTTVPVPTGVTGVVDVA
jgi:hypothetical protein